MWKLWQFYLTFFALNILLLKGFQCQRVVCYFSSWSVSREAEQKFDIANIDPNVCTHLIYAYGDWTSDFKFKPANQTTDIELGGYRKFANLKQRNRNLKVLLAFGGTKETSARFSKLSGDSESRRKFIQTIIEFLRKSKFDGLDLVWQYPGFRDGANPAGDKNNYATLAEEMRIAFEREAMRTNRERLLLSMVIPGQTEYVETGYDFQRLNKFVDWFNMVGYRYHTPEELFLNHAGPLYPSANTPIDDPNYQLNLDYSYKYYKNLGADLKKIVLGIPLFGITFGLINEEVNNIGQPADGPGIFRDGALTYNKICQILKDEKSWTVIRPEGNVSGPYAYKKLQWMSFDDENMARIKAEYAAKNGFGGIMFWSIDQDDFRGYCTGINYPIIKAAKEAFNKNQGRRWLSSNVPDNRTTDTAENPAVPFTLSKRLLSEAELMRNGFSNKPIEPTFKISTGKPSNSNNDENISKTLVEILKTLTTEIQTLQNNNQMSVHENNYNIRNQVNTRKLALNQPSYPSLDTQQRPGINLSININIRT